MVAEPEETIMIGLDNSAYMALLKPYGLKLQLECIRSYCEAKLKSNPKTEIGMLTITKRDYDVNWLSPTSKLDKIEDHLNRIFACFGELDVYKRINNCLMPFHLGNPSKKRRILFFIAGCVNFGITEALMCAKLLIRHSVAVDVIHFKIGTWRDDLPVLTRLVNAANDSGNSHIQQIIVKPNTKLADIITSESGIFPLDSPHKDPKGNNQAAAHDDEYVKADKVKSSKRKRRSGNNNKKDKYSEGKI